jgi:hypothetical protein
MPLKRPRTPYLFRRSYRLLLSQETSNPHGWKSIDVPEPAIWLFFIGVPLFIVSILLIAVSGVLWATKRARSKAF